MQTEGTSAQTAELGERVRVERQVLALQCAIAAFFVAGALAGMFRMRQPAGTYAVAWIAAYHLLHTWYVLAYRMPGRPSRIVEILTPLCDVSCITAAWVVMGDAASPFWAVYLYALVGYTRRYHGKIYLALAAYIIANIALGRLLLSPHINSALVTALVLATAMALLAHAIGTAWRRTERQARMLAETDPLTGISNRRTFLDRLVAVSDGADATYAVLMLDLDDFKRLNDQHGHLHGDAVLVDVAQALAKSIREGDSVARYGGEEFIMAMPGAGLDEAVTVAERLRRMIAETTPTTISIGCAARLPGERAESVVRRADEMLLAAKRNGKNGVRSARDTGQRAA